MQRQHTAEVLKSDWQDDGKAHVLSAKRDMRLCEALPHKGNANQACNMQLSVLSSHEDRLERRSLGAYASQESALHEVYIQLFGVEHLHYFYRAEGA